MPLTTKNPPLRPLSHPQTSTLQPLSSPAPTSPFPRTRPVVSGMHTRCHLSCLIPSPKAQDRLAHHAFHVQYVPLRSPSSLLTPGQSCTCTSVLALPVASLPSSQSITFMDKTTLGQAAVLGIECGPSLSSRFDHSLTLVREGAHLNATQFNWLGTIFYFSYLIFQYPQNLALQRFPVGKWMRYRASSPFPPR